MVSPSRLKWLSESSLRSPRESGSLTLSTLEWQLESAMGLASPIELSSATAWGSRLM
jgi:hypothetical protein